MIKAVKMDSVKVFIYYRESLVQALCADVLHFGFLLVCIFASRGSLLWELVCFVLFLLWVVARVGVFQSDKVKRFHTQEALIKYIEDDVYRRKGGHGDSERK